MNSDTIPHANVPTVQASRSFDEDDPVLIMLHGRNAALIMRRARAA